MSAAETRGRPLSTLPAGLFLLLCLVASLSGGFVAFCVALVLLAILGAENTLWGAVFALIATATGLVLPTVLLRKSRKKHRREIAPNSLTPKADSTAALSRVQAAEKRTELADNKPGPLTGPAYYLKIPNPDHGLEKLDHTPDGNAGTRDQTKPVNHNTKDSRNWIFPACALGLLIMGAFLIFANKQDSSNLEVELTGAYLTVRNIGTQPIRLLGVSINDRAECEPHLGLPPLGPFKATDLKVGEFVVLASPCISIVRTTLRTETGSWTYSFAR
jgi:hypothetical protein